eukprot:CAMPEP_0178432694 /NCGR_PEP_ID=MMETSP0689_2-20121128/32521_1 /TAXON_ID=160604 /ORGANISM="Amphidinium massartii, Strain CS-259" /LENGTH=571 /DNA_ID=CAMNT_0020054697 /DNA_START=76 /DNA_END=1791 /DNA_ORIENTATION=-
MNSNYFFSVFYPTITWCAQLCDTSSKCKSFSWGFRGEAVWTYTDSEGREVKLGLCVVHSVNTSTHQLENFVDYDFYEEDSSGPTIDPGAQTIPGYIGPFNGTSTSGIDDITPVGGISVNSPAECATLCNGNPECRSFDYGARWPATGDCHLTRLNREEAGPAFTVWPVYDYYEKLLPSILEYMSDASSGLSILRGAFRESGLDQKISGPGPFTIFAPSDEVLQRENIASAADLLNLANSQATLEFHVALGRFEERILQDSDKLLTAHGDKLEITKNSNGAVLADAVRLTTTNIECSNGVIHIIDGILSPPTDLDQLSIMDKLNTRGFTVLSEALTRTGVAAELASQGDWTLFAPTDTAINAFRLSEGLTQEQFLGSAQLRSILRSHIALGSIYSATSDTASVSVTVLEGEPLTMQRTPGGGYFIVREGSVAAMGPFDLDARDGVLHAIDRVMADPDRNTDGADRLSDNEGAASSGDSDDDSPIVIILIAVVAALLVLGGIAFFCLLRKRKSTPKNIPEMTIEQDGVTVVMGKPVGNDDTGAAAAAATTGAPAGRRNNNKGGDEESGAKSSS